MNSHAGLNSLLRGEKLLQLLAELSEEPMLLFKEKINYKLAGSGRFSPLFYSIPAMWVLSIPLSSQHCLKLFTNNKPVSGGFAPHIDAVAYTHIKDVKHLTILLAVDPSNMKNGGLEVVSKSHEMDIPIDEKTHCITDKWTAENPWAPVELEAGN